ncbi:M15 family metallopeptidase [Jiulongibacter sp. NS-SX5]|uniref:M15 family metallopeptidase n=1 Tax=Jiulongibacter sp. NS-SX5 TaxID=3463854 RepID=UPI004059022F
MKEILYSFILLFGLVQCTDSEETQNTETYRIRIAEPEEDEPEELGIGEFEQSLIYQGLVDIQSVDPSIYVDLKYSTVDNFFEEDVYGDLTRAYLPKNVAEALKVVNNHLKSDSSHLRLWVFDAVRPHGIQRILWNALDSIPVANRRAFVADPERGSLHNYGCAVDLSIYDTHRDTLLDMGTKYDYFGYLAYPRKEAEMLASGSLNREQIGNRQLLRNVMRKGGFLPINSEWWHFNITTLANAKENYKLIQ